MKTLLRLFVLSVLSVLCFAASANAQTQLVVNLATATLKWDYTQGANLATEFRVKCGSASNNYTRTTVIPDITVRTVSIRSVIGGSGVWFCRNFSANKYGESAGSNEVNFDGGDSPSTGPSNLTPQP